MKHTCIVLFLALFCVATVAQESAWKGTLNIQGTDLPLVFHFNADGNTMDSPAQGAFGIPVEKSYTEDGQLKLTISMIGAFFQGTVDGDSIVGTFQQGGISLPLVLKPDNEKPNRPQIPRAPFPYETKDVSFQNDGFVFHGTLTLPLQYNKHTPILVMVTGSGIQDRNEEIFYHQPFAVIADALARQGIATFRYDDRGWNDANYQANNGSILDYKEDAKAAVRYMKKKFHHVGLLGHSEGGTIALMLAAEKKIDFCVSLAGMAISGKETLLQQNRTILQAQHFSSEIVDEYCTALVQIYDATIAGKEVEDIAATDLPQVLSDNLMLVRQELPQSRYLQDFLKTDVSPSLSKVKCPVLALNGTLDTQVDCEKNLSIIDKGLVNSKHEVVYCGGMNHLFQHCQTGLDNEYLTIEETIAPDVLKKIADWIKAL